MEKSVGYMTVERASTLVGQAFFLGAFLGIAITLMVANAPLFWPF
jgi:hypothetical protein